MLFQTQQTLRRRNHDSSQVQPATTTKAKTTTTSKAANPPALTTKKISSAMPGNESRGWHGSELSQVRCRIQSRHDTARSKDGLAGGKPVSQKAKLVPYSPKFKRRAKTTTEKAKELAETNKKEGMLF